MLPLRKPKQQQRRGAVVFLVLILIPVLLGFGALTIDVGVLYNTRADLQNAADAAAMAATSVLVNDRTATGMAAARQAAQDVLQRHVTLGRSLGIDASDLEFGRLTYDKDANRYDFTPTTLIPHAVRVNVRRSAGSVNGATPLFFAGIFGKRSTNIEASALAGLGGKRDIALVVDLTYTMSHDSMTFHSRPHTAENGSSINGTQINLRDIWCALNGPAPNRPYIPGTETQTQYASDTGPTVGVMNTWGNQILPNTYNPTTDPGLWYIPNNAPCTVAAVTASLTSRGYNASRRNTIMNSSSSSTWRNRVAVMTGLANWTPSSGSDTSVGDSELTWTPLPSYAAGWTWSDYINFMASDYTYMAYGDSRFKFRFGLKTFTEFLLERPENHNTSILWQTPQQPLQAIKDAVQTFVNVLEDAGGVDQVSLESFDTQGRHHIDLTEDVQTVADRLYQFQAAHYAQMTNLGAGLSKAVDELTSARARSYAEKVIVVLSDGQPNTNQFGTWDGYGSLIASNYALEQADRAADEGIKIFAITVGLDANRSLMQSIAAAANGQEFQAAGDPATYTSQLQNIFYHLGHGDMVMLIE